MRRRAVPTDLLHVLGRRIPLVLRQSVAGERRVHLLQQAIAPRLGEDGGGGDVRALRISLDPLHFLVKKITTAGTFRFGTKLLYLANSLVDQHIGLEETDDGIWPIYFNAVLISTLDERDDLIRG